MHSHTFRCLIEGNNKVFKVEIATDEDISDLKDKVHEKGIGQRPVLAKDLTLLKVEIDLMPHTTAESLSQVAINPVGTEMLDWMEISEVWQEPPARRALHIIAKIPPATVSPSTSQDSNLSQESLQNWLAELHQKLWGKGHLFGSIFRTVTLTTNDFVELQLELQSVNPSRTEPSYKAHDVLKVKAEFLHRKSCEATWEPNTDELVPSVSRVVTSPSTLDDAMDVDANPAPEPDNCPSYIIADAKELSSFTGSTAVFPCTIRYMDLTTFDLKIPTLKRLTLIRDEWNTMIDLFNGRKRGVLGSAVFTGSPGIGKTCLLYYILILCFIKAQPVVFQDTCGDVYLITDEVRSQSRDIRIAGDDVLTLIDADGSTCQPYKYIFHNTNLYVLLTSSPRSRKDRKWLKSGLCSSLWSTAYFFRLFIAEKDITLSRFWKTYKICGSVPRQFLHAAESCEARKTVQTEISDVIQKSKDVKAAMDGVVGDEVVPHRAFAVYPSTKVRLLTGCHVKAISKGAMNTIIKALHKESTETVLELYQSIRGSPKAATFRSNLWELKAHWYLPYRGGCSFTIQSLENGPDGQLDLLKNLEHFVFGPPLELSSKIADCMDARQSIYLQPISDNFASLDAIIFQPQRPLVGIQVTNALTHPIKTKGLKALQSHLSLNNELLSPLRPTPKEPWPIIFVVPAKMERSFTKQSIEGDASATWRKKTVHRHAFCLCLVTDNQNDLARQDGIHISGYSNRCQILQTNKGLTG
ncbi:uncharacterized protein LACBIDRAFT_327283 [Laccaria bicolor S238N-H82]|uniref:Predicted protein n=1 Tax=Laccaria bicolor (strain S238N-H82 / ATCC MYA-4686) TaxID=486041 RepID=B0DBR3_LACBS|nr:uncharacterized protein LACBIDRAFT_327283 [Laccaria bicolor S238N-H82]EDR08045.1 predicted protein [Laccaria bicolor S238N-H82]|eukprot:XP_001881115.1 predicted protein [Laccaria bicolor S238N-H82]